MIYIAQESYLWIGGGVWVVVCSEGERETEYVFWIGEDRYTERER
jgi:hypothetical protein